MKNNIYIKFSRRSYLTMLLLFLSTVLTAAILGIHAAEAMQTQKQLERINNYYRPIGTLVSDNMSENNVAEGAKIIRKNQDTYMVDERIKLTAVLPELYNADLDGTHCDSIMSSYGNNNVHVNDVLLYGVLADVYEERRTYLKKDGSTFTHQPFSAVCLLFQVDDIEAGYPEYAAVGDKVKIYYHSFGEETDAFDVSQLEIGKRYFLKACYEPVLSAEVAYLENYDEQVFKENLFLKAIDGQALWYIPVAAGEEIDFSAEKYKMLRDEMETQNENRHSLYLTATKDMTSMPSFQQVSNMYYLKEGRLIDSDDNLEKRRVCVIRDEFAKLRGLSIGDKLSLTLRDLNGTDFLGYINDTTLGWKEAPTHSEEFQIVGTVGAYPSEMNLDIISGFYNDIYVPVSCVPEKFGPDTGGHLAAENFSFVLKSYEVKEDFSAKVNQELTALGMRVSFVEKDMADIGTTLGLIRQSVLVKMVLFVVIFVLVILIIIFLYLKINQINFAIQRTLGVAKAHASRQMLIPIASITVIGVTIGEVFAWIYMANRTNETIQSILDSANLAPTELSFFWFFIPYIMMILIVAASLWGGITILCRKGILEIFQKQTDGYRKNRKAES